MCINNLLLPALIVGGCSVGRDDYNPQPIVGDLHVIETLDIGALSVVPVASDANVHDLSVVYPAEIVLDLAECRRQSLINNLGIKAELFNPSIADESVNIEESRFEGVFYSGVAFDSSDSPTATSLESNQEKKLDIDWGVKLPLRTGGEIAFDMASGRDENSNSFTTINPAYTSVFTVSVSQPLLREAGVRVNTYAIVIAEYQSQISQSQTRLAIIRILAETERFYWCLYATRRQLEVRQKEYELADAQLAWVKRRVAAGVSPEVETIRAQAGVAARLEGVIIAENLVRLRQRQLKRIMNQKGLGVSGVTNLVPGTEPTLTEYRLNRPKVVKTAIENRMELLEIELQIAQDVSAIGFYRNQVLPMLAVDYEYNINGLGASWADAYETTHDANFQGHAVSLRLEVPLGNLAAKSRLQQALLRKAQRLATREQRRQVIENEVLTTVDQIETSWQRVLACRQRTILAADDLRAEERQFELGLRTSIDVLDAQERFADAQSAEIAALTDYQIAQVDLAYATGTIMGAARVRWHDGKLPTGAVTRNNSATEQ